MHTLDTSRAEPKKEDYYKHCQRGDAAQLLTKSSTTTEVRVQPSVTTSFETTEANQVPTGLGVIGHCHLFL